MEPLKKAKLDTKGKEIVVVVQQTREVTVRLPETTYGDLSLEHLEKAGQEIAEKVQLEDWRLIKTESKTTVPLSYLRYRNRVMVREQGAIHEEG